MYYLQGRRSRLKSTSATRPLSLLESFRGIFLEHSLETRQKNNQCHGTWDWLDRRQWLSATDTTFDSWYFPNFIEHITKKMWKKNFQLKVWYIWPKIVGKIKKWAIHYFFQFLNKSICYFFQTIQGIFWDHIDYYWQNVWSHENLELFRKNTIFSRKLKINKEMDGTFLDFYQF